MLGALTLGASAWLVLADPRWAPPDSDAPWGPLVVAFPVVAGLALVGWFAALEWRRGRELRL